MREECETEWMEARLDFDEDMPEIDTTALLKRIEEMQATMESSLKTASRGRLLRQGLQVGQRLTQTTSMMFSLGWVDCHRGAAECRKIESHECLERRG